MTLIGNANPASKENLPEHLSAAARRSVSCRTSQSHLRSTVIDKAQISMEFYEQ